MATSEIKNTASDIKSGASSTLRDTMRDAKYMGEKAMDETTPRVRESIDQFSEVASDLMNKANHWMKQGNNRNYSFVALAAVVGVAGFFIGRTMNSSSSES